MSPSSTPADIIARLQDQGDMFARKIEVEKRKIDDLQGKIDTLLAKSADQRKKWVELMQLEKIRLRSINA